METIRTTVFFACCTALGLTLAEGILPMERFKRQIRLMMTLILMTAILKPLTQFDFSSFSPDFSAAEDAAHSIEALAEEARNAAVSESICNALNQSLEQHSVNCRVTAVHLHIQDDGGIVIDEVVITGNALTGTVYLREWLGADISIAKEVTDTT